MQSYKVHSHNVLATSSGLREAGLDTSGHPAAVVLYRADEHPPRPTFRGRAAGTRASYLSRASERSLQLWPRGTVSLDDCANPRRRPVSVAALEAALLQSSAATISLRLQSTLHRRCPRCA